MNRSSWKATVQLPSNHPSVPARFRNTRKHVIVSEISIGFALSIRGKRTRQPGSLPLLLRDGAGVAPCVRLSVHGAGGGATWDVSRMS